MDNAFRVCAAVLTQSPAGLFTDFDGTLSHVARTPGEAVLAAGAGEALNVLAGELAIVAIVTGRAAGDAQALVGSDQIAVIGNHGLERLTAGGRVVHPSAVAQVQEISAAVESIRRELESDSSADGLVFENKELSASIHYRLAQNHDAARARLLSLANREAALRSLQVTEGRLVIELRPTVSVNKGTALREAVEELGLHGSVFLGDDLTDVDAFLELRELRKEGMASVSVAVLASETDPIVRASADEHVDGVDECVQLISRLARHHSRQGAAKTP